MISPINLLNANISTPKFFKKHRKKENESKNQEDDDVHVVEKKEAKDNEDKAEIDGPQFIDELANVPVMSMDDFVNKYVEDTAENESDSSDETEAFNLEQNYVDSKSKLFLINKSNTIKINFSI